MNECEILRHDCLGDIWLFHPRFVRLFCHEFLEISFHQFQLLEQSFPHVFVSRSF
ncbi:MAG: hypothetical protein OZSIB_1485 [Candidatus Ozemobacter sibiricus]|uniref:Uncharacterized protein n=1 Tax=Candidatus Ozemobacter sibiricus TaxID=2268124 RepID=A0A367ZJS6_9BACT|nr:MAG: hypothetical protein OZSIB_1485 [Candidatus Ozemobacter sibiricus]